MMRLMQPRGEGRRRRLDLPGAAHLVLAEGVVHLDEAAAVFQAMLDGWARQQRSRLLADETVRARLELVRRFQAFTGEYPWQWTPGDVEDFTAILLAGDRPRAHSTIRNYHNTLELFCEYVTDPRYDWAAECLTRFGEHPVQICHEGNTAQHLVDYEGRPGNRPLTSDELQALFDHADARVEAIVRRGRKGALAALRDAQMLKTAYAFGLRRRELVRLDVADLRVNPHAAQWGRYGSLHVRRGKATRGSPPKRRTVLAVPEFDWAIEGLQQWVEAARPRFGAGQHPALWVTERASRVDVRYLDDRFVQLRDELGLPGELNLHCLRHSYVTHLAEFGYPERFIQEQVGHAYASTTAIYTAVSNDFKNQMVARALRRVYGPRGRGDRR
jgi:integrase/recombinase XerC